MKKYFLTIIAICTALSWAQAQVPGSVFSGNDHHRDLTDISAARAVFIAIR